MEPNLRAALNQYANREIDLAAFEDWLVSHLQLILDSHDSDSIDIANNLDARFIELGEGLIAEQELFNTAQALLPPAQTLPVTFGVTVNAPSMHFDTTTTRDATRGLVAA
jgi:hypothetical protein